jgi:hypothetical protein
MVQDYTAADDRLKAAAQGQNVPNNLDQQHASALQQLQGASGRDSDRRYVQHQLTGTQPPELARPQQAGTTLRRHKGRRRHEK